jgi:hypothetical protein
MLRVAQVGRNILVGLLFVLGVSTAEKRKRMQTTQPHVSAGTVTPGRAPSQPRARRFYVGIALFMIIIVLAGFWPSYFRPLSRGVVDKWPWVIHLHAATFIGWMALLLTQVLLVSTGRTRIHRKLGTFGIGYGILVIFIGLVVSFALQIHHLAVDGWEMNSAARLLLIGWSDIAWFAGFFGAAIAYRRRPETHKRLMVLAAVALTLPGTGRLALAIFGMQMLIIVLVVLSPVLIAMGHDVLTRRRIHPTYLIGTPILLGRLVWQFAVVESEPGLEVGRRVLTTLMGGAVQ